MVEFVSFYIPKRKTKISIYIFSLSLVVQCVSEYRFCVIYVWLASVPRVDRLMKVSFSFVEIFD